MSQIDRRQALRLIAALGVAGSLPPALSACSSGSEQSAEEQEAKDPIKVGMIVPQNGVNKSIGQEISNGFQLYLRDHNGRLGNHPVNVVLVDEGETAASAKAAAEQLVKQQIKILTGVSNAAALSAVRDVVETGKIPLVSPAPSLSDLANATYVWRTGFVTDEPGRALGRWVADHSHGPVFVLAGEGVGVREDVRAFVAALKAAGGTTAGEPAFVVPGSKEFGTQLTALRAPTVGALFCAYTGAAGVEVVARLRDAGLPKTLQIYGPGPLTEGTQLTQQGEAASGIFTAMNYAADLNTVDNRRFVSAYQKAYNAAPSSYAVASYDAATVLDEALALAGADIRPLAVNGAIAKLGQVRSPRGEWQFNQTRSPLQKWFLRQVRADGPVLANVLAAELVTLG